MKEQIYEAVLDWGVYYTSFAVTRQNVKREDNTYFDYWSTRKPKSYHRYIGSTFLTRQYIFFNVEICNS